MVDVIELLSQIALSTESMEVKRLTLLNGFLKITHSDYWCCAKVQRGGNILEHITNIAGQYAETNFLHQVNSQQTLLDLIEEKYDLNECHVISRSEISKDTVEDDYLLSIEHLDDGHYSLIKFIRSGDRYNNEDREQLKSLVSQIYWIHLGIDFEEDIIGNHTPLPIAESTIQLTPRLHETLMHIVYNGYSNKQIAEEMGVSVHTIKEYVKALQMHFLVSSRSELTASFLNDVYPLSINKSR
ncbi:MAG: LuxR C-terminal-related transcriptional regulator [Lentisphaerales bacterium]|nr:LuxR C-terminal-related transcriptional regulator [Lentisphaerales bacterium]